MIIRSSQTRPRAASVSHIIQTDSGAAVVLAMIIRTYARTSVILSVPRGILIRMHIGPYTYTY